MANTIPSPNMAMPVPVPTVDPGPDWAVNLTACFAILDQHNHSAGNGVQIVPSGINVNSDFPFNVNNATLLRSANFSAQAMPLALASDVGCLYVSGVDLYYNDELGNQVRITQSGGVAGSPGSISGLTSPASASYVSLSKTFVWQSDANTPANMDGASYILRNLVASSKGLTLNPPNAMGADYSITLPTLPSVASVLTIDNSGSMGSQTYDQVAQNMTSVGANAIGVTMTATGADAIGATMTATGADAVANSRTRSFGITVPAGGIATSSSCNIFSTTATSLTIVTGMNCTLTTTGRAVQLMIQPDGSGSPGIVTTTGGDTVFWRIVNTTTAYQLFTASGQQSATFSSGLVGVDVSTTGLPGTYTYRVEMQTLSGNACTMQKSFLTAYEL